MSLHTRSTFNGISFEINAMANSQSATRNSKLIRPLVRDLHAYVPGEQPKIKGLIKLNTNENPYPPSPRVLAAVRAAVDGRLRLYPNPTAQALREKLAKLHGCAPENIIIGNGSDEVLALAVRGFVEPVAAFGRTPPSFISAADFAVCGFLPKAVTGASSSGMPRTVFRFAVMSSPSVPSPRVTPSASLPWR